MSGLNPQHQRHPEWGPLPKVFIAYAHNPLPYVQIAPPDSDKVIQSNPEMSTEMVHERWEEEVARHMRREEKAIEDNKLLVYHLATFLQKSSIAVAYDQLLTDVGTSNLMKWSQEQIKDSDFVILIITPSFCNFLFDEVPPEKEYLFAGHYLYNLIHNPPLNKSLLPVFLNQVKDIQLLPKALEASICYEIWEPFDVQHGPRNDDLESFYALLTRQNRYEQPKPPSGGPVKIPPPRRKRSKSVFITTYRLVLLCAPTFLYGFSHTLTPHSPNTHTYPHPLTLHTHAHILYCAHTCTHTHTHHTHTPYTHTIHTHTPYTHTIHTHHTHTHTPYTRTIHTHTHTHHTHAPYTHTHTHTIHTHHTHTPIHTHPYTHPHGLIHKLVLV